MALWLWRRAEAGDQIDPEAYYAVHVPPAERAAFRAFRDSSRAWQEAERRLEQAMPQAPWLLEDLYHALSPGPAPLNPDVHPAFHWNFSVIASLIGTPEWYRLRAAVAGDAAATALAAIRVAEEVTSERLLSSPLRQLLAKAWRARASVRSSRAIKLRMEAKLHGLVLHHIAAKAAGRTRARLEFDAQLRSTWGFYPGQQSLHALDDLWSLLEMARNMPGIEDLTEALQAFQSLLRSKPRRRRESAGLQRITGFTYGFDLEKAAAEELVKLTDPDLEDLFEDAYARRRLLQHAYRGPNSRPKGAIACCIDVSRSMNTPAALGRERFLWAKAVALALLDLARREERPFLGLCFSSEQEVAAFPVRRGAYRPETALRLAQWDFNGGTHLETPLRWALDYLGGKRSWKEVCVLSADAEGPASAAVLPTYTASKATGEATDRRADETAGSGDRVEHDSDIVLLTDGEVPVSRSFAQLFKDAKSALRLRLHTVLIDGNNADLEQLSDRVFRVESRRIGSWEQAVLAVGRSLQRD